MKKMFPILAVVVILVGVFSFYAGMKYAQGGLQVDSRTDGSGRQFAAGSGFRDGFSGAGGMRGGVATGEIISKDEQSLIIKLRDGGSKIIFLSDSTNVTKSVKGSELDLVVGSTVVANGKQNPDGSLTAENVQLRQGNTTGRQQ